MKDLIEQKIREAENAAEEYIQEIGDLTIREYFENQTNYKELLKKYIKYVNVHEGIDFISNDIYKNESSTFTLKEWETLKQLANETK